MAVYVGSIVYLNEHYNFHPSYSLQNGKLNEIDLEGFKLEYGTQHPNIEISFIESQKDLYKNNILWVLEFDNNDISPTRSGIEIRDPDLISKGKLKSINEYGYHMIVTAEGVAVDFDDKIVIKSDSTLAEGEKVFLYYNKKFFGPYNISLRNYDGKFCILNPSGKNRIVKYLYEADVDETEVSVYKGFRQPVEKVLLIKPKKDRSPNYEDVISDKDLLLFLQKVVSSYAKPLSDLKFEDISQNLLNSLAESNDLVPYAQISAINNERLDRVKNIFNSISAEAELENELISFVGNTLVSLMGQEDPNFDVIIKHILEDSNYRLAFQKSKMYTEDLRRLTEEIADKERILAEYDQVREQAKEEAKGLVHQEITEELRAAINELEQQKANNIDLIAEQENTISNLKIELADLINAFGLKGSIKNLQYDKQNAEKQLKQVNDDLKKAVDNLNSNIADKMASITFDGMISNAMLKASETWEEQKIATEYNSLIEKVKEIQTSDLTDEDLINYLVDTVKHYRKDYDKNLILNLFICLSQNLLTVFAGKPGTGKTSLCKIIANTLGLNKLEDLINENPTSISANRFIPISVERGWTSKRDFIGYYNPLTKKFDQSNRKVFDAFKVLDTEKTTSEYPFLILLDEANLSSMEYYWADFMNICDDKDENSFINLGEEYQFFVPDTLRFVATINNDHTTETLSPRLIDRSWIITLPTSKKLSFNTLKLTNDIVTLIPWNTLSKVFNPTYDQEVELDTTISEPFEEIVNVLEQYNEHISYRSKISISKYLNVAEKIFVDDTDNGISSKLVALDYAVLQKILPKLQGSGESYEFFLIELKKIFNKYDLRMSKEKVEEIINRGEINMGYYTFFN